MDPAHTWIDVLLTAIAAVPGVIAAASSLKNGRTLKNGGQRPSPQAKKHSSKGSADWYRKPDV